MYVKKNEKKDGLKILMELWTYRQFLNFDSTFSYFTTLPLKVLKHIFRFSCDL